MSPNEVQNRIKQLMREGGNLKQVAKELYEYLNQTSDKPLAKKLLNEVVVLEADLNELESKDRQNLLEKSYASTKRNLIRKSFLSISDELSSLSGKDEMKQSRKNRRKKLILSLAIVGASLAIGASYFLLKPYDKTSEKNQYNFFVGSGTVQRFLKQTLEDTSLDFEKVEKHKTYNLGGGTLAGEAILSALFRHGDDSKSSLTYNFIAMSADGPTTEKTLLKAVDLTLNPITFEDENQFFGIKIHNDPLKVLIAYKTPEVFQEFCNDYGLNPNFKFIDYQLLKRIVFREEENWSSRSEGFTLMTTSKNSGTRRLYEKALSKTDTSFWPDDVINYGIEIGPILGLKKKLRDLTKENEIGSELVIILGSEEYLPPPDLFQESGFIRPEKNYSLKGASGDFVKKELFLFGISYKRGDKYYIKSSVSDYLEKMLEIIAEKATANRDLILEQKNSFLHLDERSDSDEGWIQLENVIGEEPLICSCVNQ